MNERWTTIAPLLSKQELGPSWKRDDDRQTLNAGALNDIVEFLQICP
jgi:hypothetical protein